MNFVIKPAHNKGLLSAGQLGFSQVSFFYLTLLYSDRKRLRFAPPNSKPQPLNGIKKINVLSDKKNTNEEKEERFTPFNNVQLPSPTRPERRAVGNCTRALPNIIKPHCKTEK